jgi:hypothetical protein
MEQSRGSGGLVPSHDLALDYIYLRKAIGVLALLLPTIVVLGKWSLDRQWALEGSISLFYYTHSRNFFVGILCALAVFFLSYEHGATGKFKADNYWSGFASAMALGVAFLPTMRTLQATSAERVVGVLHLVCAGALFVILGVFAIHFFRMSDGPVTQEKVKRNKVYLACGSIIFACLGAVVASEIFKPPAEWNVLFFLETVMVWAFAVSWLIKGGFLGILADKEEPAPAPVDAPAAGATTTSSG